MKPSDIIKLIGKKRFDALSAQTPMQGKADEVLNEICKEITGAHPGRPDADVAQAAIRFIQRAGSHPTPEDVKAYEAARAAAAAPAAV